MANEIFFPMSWVGLGGVVLGWVGLGGGGGVGLGWVEWAAAVVVWCGFFIL